MDELTTTATPNSPLMLGYALRYIKEPLNWRLCRLMAGSKRPMLTAWNSPERAISTPEVVFSIWDNPGSASSGMGLCHEASMTAAFDVDHLDYTVYAFNEFGIDILELMKGFPRIKGREGRDKIIFSMPESLPTVKLVWPANPAIEGSKPTTVFELRGKGGQDVLPPSIHPDTQAPYTWVVAPWDLDSIQEIPKPLFHLMKNWQDFKSQMEATCPWAVEAPTRPTPTPRVVNTESVSIIKKFNDAHSVTALLEAYGYKKRGKRWISSTSSSGIAGVVVFNDGEKERVYSHHASDPLNNGRAHDAFDLFVLFKHDSSLASALSDAATSLGIVPSYAQTMEMNVDGLIASSKKKVKKAPIFQAAPATYEFPKHLLKFKGLVGELAQYMGDTAMYPQPVLELGASLAFCGALMGRKIRTETNIRTNIYAIGINYSGSGKEHARKVIKKLSVEANAINYVGAEKIASDAGLFNLLNQSPSTLWIADEFGRTLKALNNLRAPAHLQNLSTQIMELSGSADSYLIEPRKALTGTDDNLNKLKRVVNPNLCIYGTTVPGRLFDSLTPEEIEDGFLPRWLLFESDTYDQEPQEKKDVNADALIKKIQEWATMPINANPNPDMNCDFLNVNPRIAPTTPEAKAILDKFGKVWRTRKTESRGFGIDAMWARAYEHALRVSLIVAGGINIDNPVIDAETAQQCCELVEFLLMRSSSQAMACVATNDYDAAIKKISAYIKENSPATKKMLAIKFQHIKAKERNEMLLQMIEAELIGVDLIKTGGKGAPETNFHWIG